jgi:hypothetical protein
VCRLPIAWLTVFRFWGCADHGGVGEACVMAWSTVAGSTGAGGHFGVSGGVLVAAVTLPEWGSSCAGGVVVGW